MNILYSYGLDLVERENTVVTLFFHSQGANSYGQLGAGHTDDMITPSIPCSLQDKTLAIKQVTGGGGHTVILTGK